MLRIVLAAATLALSAAAWRDIVGSAPTLWDHVVALLVAFLTGVGGGTIGRRLRKQRKPAMTKIALTLALLATAAAARAAFLPAFYVSQEQLDALHVRCTFETLSGIRFSFNVRGICPARAEYDPETNQVRR